MKLQTEWNEFLALLSTHRVRFVMIGGLALAAHGRVRFTKDLDVFVEPTVANARRVGRALHDFGFRATARAWRRLARPNAVLSLGNEPIAIDILTSIPGVTFARAWKGKVIVTTPKYQIPVIGLAELRANKLACGRPQDISDLALLDQIEVTRAASRSRSTRRRAVAQPSRRRGTAGARKNRPTR